MSDEELMARYLDGDDAAFTVLYQKHSGKVYAFLKKKLTSREEVDELFQASFLKFHRVRRKYNPKYPVLQWLFVIVRSTLIDHYRKSGRAVEIADVPVEFFSDSLSQEQGVPSLSEERVDALLKVLPEQQREVVARRLFQEESYTEIALSLNRSEESVRQMVSRALKKIRGVLVTGEGRKK